MAGKMTKSAYQKLIQEDIDYLKQLPDTLERKHIISVLEDSVRVYYDHRVEFIKRMNRDFLKEINR